MSSASGVTSLILVALAASIATGVAGVAALELILRAGRLRHTAGARFVLWFALLVSFAFAGPACFGAGVLWVHRIPAAPVRPAAARTQSVESVASEVRALRADTRAPRKPIFAAPPLRPEPSRIGLVAALGILWLAGFLISLLRTGIGLARLRRITGAADVIETRATSRGPVRILASDHFSVPIAMGYRNPAILIPRSILRLERDSDLENVLMHEIEHLRRFDDVTSLVQSACIGALWFNPLAHYVAARIAETREMACDEAVIVQTGRRSYVATLWKIALDASDALTPPLASAFSSRPHTISRLDNLLSARIASPHVRRRTIVASAAVLLAGMLGSAALAPAMVLGTSPVTSFTSVRLADGASLVVGGRRLDDSGVGAAQLYDANGSRVAVIAMPVARWSAAATLLQSGDVLVTGGMTENGATADAEIYRARTRTFERVSPMNAARAGHTATLLRNGEVLVAAGQRESGRFVAQTEIYDPIKQHFTYSVDGVGRVNQTALLIEDGSVLMFGGEEQNGLSHCAIIWDATRHTFREAGTLRFVSAHTIAFELRGGRIVSHRF